MKKVRTCPICGNKIFGRMDKKFCSDHCRSDYNNTQNQSANNLVRNINSILRKNRRILEELNPGGRKKIHKRELSYRGFDFSYFTNIHISEKENIFYFCYDHGYLSLNNEYYLLVKWKDGI